MGSSEFSRFELVITPARKAWMGVRDSEDNDSKGLPIRRASFFPAEFLEGLVDQEADDVAALHAVKRSEGVLAKEYVILRQRLPRIEEGRAESHLQRGGAWPTGQLGRSETATGGGPRSLRSGVTVCEQSLTLGRTASSSSRYTPGPRQLRSAVTSAEEPEVAAILRASNSGSHYLLASCVPKATLEPAQTPLVAVNSAMNSPIHSVVGKLEDSERVPASPGREVFLEDSNCQATSMLGSKRVQTPRKMLGSSRSRDRSPGSSDGEDNVGHTLPSHILGGPQGIVALGPRSAATGKSRRKKSRTVEEMAAELAGLADELAAVSDEVAVRGPGAGAVFVADVATHGAVKGRGCAVRQGRWGRKGAYQMLQLGEEGEGEGKEELPIGAVGEKALALRSGTATNTAAVSLSWHHPSSALLGACWTGSARDLASEEDLEDTSTDQASKEAGSVSPHSESDRVEEQEESEEEEEEIRQPSCLPLYFHFSGDLAYLRHLASSLAVGVGRAKRVQSLDSIHPLGSPEKRPTASLVKSLDKSTGELPLEVQLLEEESSQHHNVVMLSEETRAMSFPLRSRSPSPLHATAPTNNLKPTRHTDALAVKRHGTFRRSPPLKPTTFVGTPELAIRFYRPGAARSLLQVPRVSRSMGPGEGYRLLGVEEEEEDEKGWVMEGIPSGAFQMVADTAARSWVTSAAAFPSADVLAEPLLDVHFPGIGESQSSFLGEPGTKKRRDTTQHPYSHCILSMYGQDPSRPALQMFGMSTAAHSRSPLSFRILVDQSQMSVLQAFSFCLARVDSGVTGGVPA